MKVGVTWETRSSSTFPAIVLWIWGLNTSEKECCMFTDIMGFATFALIN